MPRMQDAAAEDAKAEVTKVAELAKTIEDEEGKESSTGVPGETSAEHALEALTMPSDRMPISLVKAGTENTEQLNVDMYATGPTSFEADTVTQETVKDGASTESHNGMLLETDDEEVLFDITQADEDHVEGFRKHFLAKGLQNAMPPDMAASGCLDTTAILMESDFPATPTSPIKAWTSSEEQNFLVASSPTLEKSVVLDNRSDWNLAGDYAWKSADSTCEARLRLRADGQWWHAAHRICPRKDAGEFPPPFREPPMAMADCWEMAETLGSWSALPVFNDPKAATSTSHKGNITLNCQHIRWASGSQSSESLGLRPTLQEKRAVEAAVAAGRLKLSYKVHECGVQNDRMLQLEQNSKRCTSPPGYSLNPFSEAEALAEQDRTQQIALRVFGFSTRYGQEGKEGLGAYIDLGSNKNGPWRWPLADLPDDNFWWMGFFRTRMC